MRIGASAFRFIERGLLFSGLLLLIMFSLAHVHRLVMFHAEMERFESKQLDRLEERGKAQLTSDSGNNVRHPMPTVNTDYSPWSAQRTKLHRASLSTSAEAMAVLRIPRLNLEAPVLEGTDEITLNRGVGRIVGTSRPGESGNIGIAGHRDGFFRPLKGIRTGDSIELVTELRTDIYAVDRIRITSPSEVSVLRPRAKPSLTLVTCYPFHFFGPAPKRYIVEATLKQ